MEQNLKLLTAIRKKGMSQKDFAKKVGEHETTISRIICGWFNIDDAKKEKFARILEREVNEIFG